jgi:hypothetical protein
MRSKIRDICDQMNCACPFWANKKILADLNLLDEKDSGNRAEIYWKQCRSPVAIYQVEHDFLRVECKLNDMTLNDHGNHLCACSNVLSREKIRKELFPGDIKVRGST